jgi:hypothetical protein
MSNLFHQKKNTWEHMVRKIGLVCRDFYIFMRYCITLYFESIQLLFPINF